MKKNIILYSILALVIVIILVMIYSFSNNQNNGTNTNIENTSITESQENLLNLEVSYTNLSSQEKQECLELGKEIFAMINKANYCTYDSDCEYDKNFLSCLNPCGIARNNNMDLSGLRQLLNRFDNECTTGCPAPGCQDNYTIKCINNKCKVQEQQLSHVCGNGVCETGEIAEGCDPPEEGPNPCVGLIFCPQDCAERNEPWGKSCTSDSECGNLKCLRCENVPSTFVAESRIAPGTKDNPGICTTTTEIGCM